MAVKGVYVAATNQHVGKTTSTLGLVTLFKNMGYDVGYCKPVGQRFLDLNDLRVDKDTLLFADLLGFELKAKYHSPVILGSGATTAYIDDPSQFNYAHDIQLAHDYLQNHHNFVIYEGTGHPGVGSVVNMSNADVAKMLGIPVIMVVEGGIGRTIDRLNMSIALFREAGVPIVGVIINKVIPEKLDKITHYLTKRLAQMDIPLLGVMPYDKSMAYPIMSSVVSAINGQVLENKEFLDNRVEDILPGSLLADFDKIKDDQNLLLVAAGDRVNRLVQTIMEWEQEESVDISKLLSGIVATGKGALGDRALEFVRQHNIPFVNTQLDTLGAVLKIGKIEVKINLHTPWKIKRAIQLIEENVDLDKIKKSLEIS